MNQEKLSVDENKDGLNTEKSGRMLIILLILLLFVGIYYFYNNIPKNKVENTSAVTSKVSEVKKNKENAPKQSQNKADKAKTVVKSQDKANIVNDTKIQTMSENKKVNLIRPTDKSSIARKAILAAGKKDPFVGANSGITSGNINKNQLITSGIIPPPPSIRGLPSIGDLPGLNIPGLPGMISKQTTPPADPIIVKGFIGNKVIVSVDGVIESLKINETFQGVKVLRIDPKNLSAKFEKDGKVITKSIKSLARVENKDNFELIKNFNK